MTVLQEAIFFTAMFGAFLALFMAILTKGNSKKNK